jgi:hypothetical protein
MAKLGKKARKFAHKHLQGGAKRSRKLRSQFNRRTRKGPSVPRLCRPYLRILLADSSLS